MDFFKLIAEYIGNGYIVHGTNLDIDMFDSSFIKGGFRAGEGYGFYFTSRPSKALDYGTKFYAVKADEFNFVNTNANPTEVFKDVINAEDDLQWLRNKQSEVRNNRDYDVYETEINKTNDFYKSIVCDSITEHIIDIIKWKKPSSMRELWYSHVPSNYIPFIAYMLLKLGYDGYREDDIYTIFNVKKLNEKFIRIDTVESVNEDKKSLDGENKYTFYTGVITILRSVMGDDKINAYEANAICSALNVFGNKAYTIEVNGKPLYNKLLVRNLFARNRERINHILSDLRPKPKDDYERKEPGFTIPKRDLHPREPSDMEKASMELLRNDEVFYDELSENTNRFPLYQDIYNKKYNNMAKKIVRLTESSLHRLISESVKKVISNKKRNVNESYTGNYRGIDGVKHIWHGEWADPEVEYDGKLVNYWDIDEYMQDMADRNGINIEDKEALNQFCIDNEDTVKQYIIDNGQPIEDDEEETDWVSYEDDEEEYLDECDNNVVRLNESQLKKVIANGVKRVINEMFVVPMNQRGDIEYPSDEEHRPNEWFEPHNNRVPQGWEMMNREDDEPLYRDEDYNEYVKDEYGRFRPVVESRKRLKESSDTDAQWKSELKAFMDGLRKGNYDVSGDTVYVEIWKSRSASNDPRYVYYKRGGNRLYDDHFYMQQSPRLSWRTINAINKRLGWNSYDDEYNF